MIINGTSGLTSNTLLIRFPIILSVYIVYRMHKVERRIVKTNAMKFTTPDNLTIDLLLLKLLTIVVR